MDDMNQDEMSANSIYTQLSVAKDEILRRWNDKDLRKKVEDFLGGKVPEIFSNDPKAVLFRNIATPNFESERFFDLASIVNLKPAYLEFSADKFCTRNKDKICLGKMCFSEKNSLNHNVFKKIIDMKESDNASFGNIKTLWGEGLTDFHHKLFEKYHGDGTLNFSDVSYLKNETKNIEELYDKFLAYFVCFGVLFENFILKEGHYENTFTKRVVYPAYLRNLERFGVAPVIIPLLPISDEEETSWMWYSKNLEKYIEDKQIN
jgi:hypothetical protein